MTRRLRSALWRFSRPHAFLGTLVAILSLYLIAAARAGSIGTGLAALGIALVACLAAAVFIVGLNQYYDVEIDRINKPFLPLAAKDLSVRQARVILALCAVTPLALGASQGGYLFGTIAVSMIIGTAYSTPPVRLKRSPLYAAACIVVVRAFVINLGIFLHFDHVVGGPGTIPAAVWALVVLTLLFSLVIAVSKDIPDTEGDRRHGIMTLPRKLGARRVFQIGRAILTGAYLLLITASFVGWIAGVDGRILVVGHALLLAALWLRSRSVVPEDQRSITQYYLFLWRLFQLEYILFPAAALLP